MSDDFLLLTGASSDLGMALMDKVLLRPDTRILAHAHRGMERLNEFAQQHPGRVIPFTADLAQANGVSAVLAAVAAHGQPSAMVHLPASRLRQERFSKLDLTALRADLLIQVESAIGILQALLPGMARLARARVVFVLSSVVHGMPPKFLTAYTVAKYAQLGLMRALAAEYAATPVRINAVSPSMVETQFLSEIHELVVQGAAASHPLGRNATPQDVVGAIDFLLTPASDYISGVALPITAGLVL